MRLRRGGMLAAIAFLVCASGAEAAQRYTSPGASGPEPCAQVSPCAIGQAVKKAKANDEVIVAAGTYVLSEVVYPEGSPGNVSVHGDFGGPMPQIVSSGTPYSLIAASPGGDLSYLSLSNLGKSTFGVYCTGGAELERIRAVAEGENAAAIYATKCTVRNSLAVAGGGGSTGLIASEVISGNEAKAHNVTSIATGIGSRGAYAACVACFSTEVLELDNSIVRGDTTDLEAGLQGKIQAGNSNFLTKKSGPEGIVDLGGNQTAPPLFADPTAGDYRETAGSPTIDGGAVDTLQGATDLDGNPRLLGAAPDIGAFEFVPPAPLPPPPPVVGRIELLELSPARFRAVNAGGAFISAKKKKKKAPIGTRVAYSLSAPATVGFTVERKLRGRRRGRRCVKQTRANRKKKRCVRFRKVKGGFSHSGPAGVGRFRFSGRVRGRALKPGRYRLVGRVGGARRTAGFRIVR